MLLEKKRLSLDEIEAQTALELPAREMLALVVVVANVLTGNFVDIDVKNNNVAVQVCAIVDVINVLVGNVLTCTIGQK